MCLRAAWLIRAAYTYTILMHVHMLAALQSSGPQFPQECCAIMSLIITVHASCFNQGNERNLIFMFSDARIVPTRTLQIQFASQFPRCMRDATRCVQLDFWNLGPLQYCINQGWQKHGYCKNWQAVLLQGFATIFRLDRFLLLMYLKYIQIIDICWF